MYDRDHFDRQSNDQKRATGFLFANKEEVAKGPEYWDYEKLGVFDRFKYEASRRLIGQDAVLTRLGLCAFAVGDQSSISEEEHESLGGQTPKNQCCHLLMDDIPGTGKTKAAEVGTLLLGGTYNRIQGTDDVQPSHVRGTEAILGDQLQVLIGKMFSNTVLGDEFNRFSTLTQAAFLDFMTEYQVSLDTFGRRLSEEELAKAHINPVYFEDRSSMFRVPDPFLFIATQNPLDQRGTNPLTEANTDRFAVMIRMTRLIPEEMDKILAADDRADELNVIKPIITVDQWHMFRHFIYYCVRVDPRVRNYISRIATAISPFPAEEEDRLRLEEKIDRYRKSKNSIDENFLSLWKSLFDKKIDVTDFVSGAQSHEASNEDSEGMPMKRERVMEPLQEIVSTGRGVRAALALQRLAKVRAACEGRLYVTPDDVQKVLPDVMGHRFYLTMHAKHYTRTSVQEQKLLDRIVSFFLQEIRFGDGLGVF